VLTSYFDQMQIPPAASSAQTEFLTKQVCGIHERERDRRESARERKTDRRTHIQGLAERKYVVCR